MSFLPPKAASRTIKGTRSIPGFHLSIHEPPEMKTWKGRPNTWIPRIYPHASPINAYDYSFLFFESSQCGLSRRTPPTFIYTRSKSMQITSAFAADVSVSLLGGHKKGCDSTTTERVVNPARLPTGSKARIKCSGLRKQTSKKYGQATRVQTFATIFLTDLRPRF